jgi:ABC-type branched-subunit amino acid transport system substrate-binding protein
LLALGHNPAPDSILAGSTVFSLAPAVTLQTAALANLAIERGARNVCVSWEQGASAGVVADAFAAALEAKGAAVHTPAEPVTGPAILDECR